MFGTVTSGSSLAMFPIDYRALNSEPSEMETFRQQMLTSYTLDITSQHMCSGAWFSFVVDVDLFPPVASSLRTRLDALLSGLCSP